MQTIDLSGINTIILDSDAETIAREECARGSYQHALLSGSARWSGADLRGAASRYSGRYADSRRGLLASMRAKGLHVIVFAGPHGRTQVAIASEPFVLRITYSTSGATAEVLQDAEGAVSIVSRRQPTTRAAGAVLTLAA